LDERGKEKEMNELYLQVSEKDLVSCWARLKDTENIDIAVQTVTHLNKITYRTMKKGWTIQKWSSILESILLDKKLI
jgi:hypothetical protein